MPVDIIRGAIGSGKSRLCMEQIRSIHSKDPDIKCIMLVPNHYSYVTEKAFVSEFGGTGLNNIEVLTLRRLAQELLDRASLNYITASGKEMLIYRAIQDFLETEDHEKLTMLRTVMKPGFVEVMSSLVSEFKRYNITPGVLFENAKKTDKKSKLREKMIISASIYKRYNELIDASAYADMEDDCIRLASEISKGGYFDKTTMVWIDKFSDFTTAEWELVSAIADKSANVTVSVDYPKEYNRLYGRMKHTYDMVCKLCDMYGAGVEYDTGTEFGDTKKPDIKFLLENWRSMDAKYAEKCPDIRIFSAEDIYGELEMCALNILDLVREEGLRFGDIAILCGRTGDYLHMIETIFSEYRIPYFTDNQIALSEHPITVGIMSVFDIILNNWSYESVFKFLKAGFAYKKTEQNGRSVFEPIPCEDIDYLENYVLKYGIRGEKSWLDDNKWCYGSGITDIAFKRNRDAENDRADSIRREVLMPVYRLSKKVSKKNTAEHFSRSVFEFLKDINLEEGLKAEIKRFRDEGHINEAEQFAKLWNLLLDVLNQAVVSGTDKKMDFSEYGKLLTVGIKKCSIRTVPSGIDQVYVGDVERSSAANIRAMFIVGAVDGTFPSGIPDEGFFSNNDRNTLLNEHNIRIAPDTIKKFEQQYFKVYRAMCSVNERLFVSYPEKTLDGKSISPSGMIEDILRVVPQAEKYAAPDSDAIYLSTPEATIHRLLIRKSEINGIKNPLWDAVYEWYENHDEYSDKLALLKRARWYSKEDTVLDKELSQRLYDKNLTYTASRLNVFAKCPYGYFMQYGMGLTEREEWEIKPTDVGIYAHELIKVFCETVEKDAKNDADKLNAWKNMTDAERDKILDDLIAAACDNVILDGAYDSKKNASILKRTGRNIKNAAKTVHMSLSKGEYVEKGLEKSFKISIAPDISIRGTIDRLDMYSGDNDDRVRIIDYKTGSTEFDVVNIVNGVDMQMIIYAVAAKELAREAGMDPRVSGIYYNRVHNKFVSVEMGNADAACEERKAALQLDGITFIKSEDDFRAEDISLAEGKNSDFLNIGYDKKGSIKARSSLHSANEIEGIMETVKDNIIEMDKKIRDGYIKCNPYQNKNSHPACAFCSFGEVCMFCNGKTPRYASGKSAEVWEEMNIKGEGVNGGS